MNTRGASTGPGATGGRQRTRTLLPGVSRSWLPTLVGTICLLIGLVDIAGAIAPRLHSRRVDAVADLVPGLVISLATAATLVLGVLLVVLARALRRRKRRAWRALMVLLPLSAVLHVLRWHQPVAAAVSVVLFIVVLANRRQFYAESDPRTRWWAVWNLLGMTLFSVGAGLVIVSVHPDAEIGHYSFTDRLRHVGYGLLGVEGPVRYASDRASDLVYFSLAGLGLLTAVSTGYLALRPPGPAVPLSTDDERRLRGLLGRHGAQDSLGYFALRRDKSVLFSPSGKAAIAFRVVSGVMLASGDPIGDVEAWPGAIRTFMREAARHAWVPAVMGCSETGGEVWTRETGLDALEIGDEAIVEVADFTLDGRPMRNVRQMVNRIERAGYDCRIRRVADLTEREKQEIRASAESWRSTDTERGFSMALGRLGDPADGECVVVTAHERPNAAGTGTPSPDGDLRAILHFVPWGRDGISLDLMRRDRGADPGLNELLIVKALQAAPGLGVARVSLNFAMFRSALARGERLGAGPVLRSWRSVLLFLSRWLQIESLYRFNAKFRPIWEPRFLVYPTARDLPRIGISTLRAEAFIALDPRRILRRAGRRRRPV
ncbi:phosphatidylglycerol lysyltransferase domain-containing protein [Rugosimonospora africana]|uniref:phosphatidylglycerol lysyltransferase domain-containing protein n=1 Tax=Rugosimonospora africana TaxID=556532 RepID=UPI001944E9E5|nr:phosphatidylglycerol lysyltransferase domain-containing protein [Rugosimonospora africana]